MYDLSSLIELRSMTRARHALWEPRIGTELVQTTDKLARKLRLMAKKGSMFWNFMAKTYSKQEIADEAAYQEKLRVSREYFTHDTDVLEFACGTGGTAILHAPFVHHIRAIDFSHKMIDIARAKLMESGITNVDFETAGIDEIFVPDGTFDVVMGMSILHLLDNRSEVIAKVHDMLKPGGVFISSTTCLSDFNPLLKAALKIGRGLRLLPTINFLSVEELEFDMGAAGFEIVHQRKPNEGAAVFLVARKG